MDSDASASAPKIDFAAHIASLKAQLEVKRKEEHEIDGKIHEVLRKNSDLPRQLNLSLSRINTKRTLVESDASQLGSSLSVISVLAENVSGKVRELDVAKGRVVDCLQRVEDLLDLRLCTEGVQTALVNEDFEQAAAHIHRFLALDSAVFKMGEDWEADGNQSFSGSHSLKHSYDVLRQAEKELKSLVEQKFDDAVADGDVASMERFFKIFPLLNQHELGLRKFSAYLRTKISSTADSNVKMMLAGGQDPTRTNVLYADTLTLLFEGIARVIEIHQPLVETYYGPDRMLNFAEYLQEECDFQAGRVLDEFMRAREYKHKAQLVDALVRQATRSPDRLDALVLDVLLSEVTLLHTRAELYLRFVKRRVAADLSSMADENPAKALKFKELDVLLKNCQLSRRMQELIGQYIAMEQYYMSECVTKAVDMDICEESLTSSMVDDTFFIIRKCVRRSLSSSSVDCVCAVLNNACTMIETDHYQLLRNKLKAGYPTVGSFAEAYTTAAAAYSSIQQGKMPPTTVEGADKARTDFLTALNNMQASAECIQTLKDTLKTDIKKHIPANQCSEHNAAKLDHCLGQLDDVATKFKDGCKFGLEQLSSAAVKPRLKSFSQLFLDYTHSPTEAEFGDFEANDPFVQSFISGLDALLSAFENLLTSANYQNLLSVVGSETARQLENSVKKCTFNRLGALQLDRELRELTNYLTSLAGWAVREKLTRLSQVSALLNVESVNEARDFYQQSGSVTWRLTPTEVRQLLALRVDLSSEEIRNAKF